MKVASQSRERCFVGRFAWDPKTPLKSDDSDIDRQTQRRGNHRNDNSIKNALSISPTESFTHAVFVTGPPYPRTKAKLFIMYERPTHWPRPYKVNKFLLLLLFAAKLYDVHNGCNINVRHREWSNVPMLCAGPYLSPDNFALANLTPRP